jgi:DNA-binding MarR family transcriptional regulator
MDAENPYVLSRVLLAAVVLLEFKKKKQPEIAEIADLVGVSEELIHHLVNQLEGLGALRRITGPFEDRVAIEDETAIEALKGEQFSANIENEVAQFAEQQKKKQADIESLFKGDGSEKKDLFASLQDQLRSGGKNDKENPLDKLMGKKDKDD